jgi:hypothetical protein
MPFTPSHIAAALPFVRTRLPIAPLVIGTMAPDVPYFVPLGVPRSLSHSPLGVPTVDLVITVVLVLLWYAAFRTPVVDLAPTAIRERMPRLGPLAWRPTDRSWGSAIVLGVLAALIGILTHLAWDAFTHRNSPLVEAVPLLHAPLGPLAVSSWLQHLSSVGGLVAIGVWAVLWARRAPRIEARSLSTPPSRILAWAAVVAAFGLSGLVVWTRGIAAGLPALDSNLVFQGASVAGGAAGFAGVLICAIWWIVRTRRPHVARAQTERSTATILPSTSASSPRIGSNEELRGSSQV